MTADMGIVFLVLGGALVLFITEIVAVDIAALLCLAALMITDVLSPQQALAALHQGISLLPHEQREAFLLKEESGLSLEEIAAVIDKRGGTAAADPPPEPPDGRRRGVPRPYPGAPRIGWRADLPSPHPRGGLGRSPAQND